jgi:hypothetical protein
MEDLPPSLASLVNRLFFSGLLVVVGVTGIALGWVGLDYKQWWGYVLVVSSVLLALIGPYFIWRGYRKTPQK